VSSSAPAPELPPAVSARRGSGGDTSDPVFTGLDMSGLPSVPPLESVMPHLSSPTLMRGLSGSGLQHGLDDDVSGGRPVGVEVGAAVRAAPATAATHRYDVDGVSKLTLPRLPIAASGSGGSDDLRMGGGGGDSSGGTRVHEPIEEAGDGDGGGLQQAFPLSGSPALGSGGDGGRQHALGTPGVYAAGPPSPRGLVSIPDA
jgi:hypothetical protein